MFYADTIPTPLGPVIAVVDDNNALVQLSLRREENPAKTAAYLVHGEPAAWDKSRLAPVTAQLQEYFEGTRTAFDLPLALRGTPFQQRVWDEMTRIPYGTTLSYKQLAARVGRPDACRAVGGASGKNPVWIVVPCHRIVGAGGTLTGYAGGLTTKQRLLALEGAGSGLFARGTQNAEAHVRPVSLGPCLETTHPDAPRERT